MKPPVQVKCPNCQNMLRVPPDMVDISVKCKHCGYVLQIRKKGPTAPQAATTTPRPAEAKAAVPVAKPYAPPSPAQNGGLPEYTPPVNAHAPAPRPFVEELPAAAPVMAGPSDYNPAFARSGSRHKGRGKYKGPRGNNGTIKLVAVGLVVLLGGGVLAAALFKPGWFGVNKEGESGKTDQANSGKGSPVPPGQQAANTGSGGTRPQPDDGLNTKPMPRRLLAIGISNYLYANSLQYGSDDKVTDDRNRRDFYKACERLADAWRIPKPQRYFLTDGPVAEAQVDYKHPPLKMVVNGTIDTFLGTSRPQDRLVIVYSGHAIEKEGEAYLVPLEGEFEETESLIPLKELYAKLEKCPAQEKLLIFDVCRYDPGHGVERPAFGKMTEELEKALHSPPAGVSVWTSCSAGQYSYEREYSSLAVNGGVPGVRNPEMFGSLFMSMIFSADAAGMLAKRPTGDGIQRPTDALPVKPVAEWLNEKTPLVVKALEKAEQKPKLTVVPRAGAEVAYNDKEPFPARFEMAKPPPTVKREEVVAMFKELELPDIKKLLKDDSKSSKLADAFPFTEAQLKDFFNDGGPSFEQIAKNPDQFAKDFPIRAAAVEALVEIRRFQQEKPSDELPDEFRSPVSDAKKKEITDKHQRTITDRQSILEELRDKLEAVSKKREMEKSKRWLATFDYAAAQTKARYAYIFEYNLALGNVKTDKLPELEGNQKGWKLASVEKMTSPGDIKAIAQEAKDGFAEIVANYPNTPWAVLSKAQKSRAFGLKWEASSFSAGDSMDGGQ